MVKFTNQQRLEIIKNHYRLSESVVATLRALTPIFGRNNRPTWQAVGAIVDKFLVSKKSKCASWNTFASAKSDCSCNLTPLEFFLWGHIKSLVYANKPATLDDLKDNIPRKIADVPVEMCARVVENWVQRIVRCKRARGGHMADIEFHS